MLDAFMQDLLGSDETATDSRSPDRDAAQTTVTGQTPGPATQAALILVPIAGRRACRDPRRAPITGELERGRAAVLYPLAAARGAADHWQDGLEVDDDGGADRRACRGHEHDD